jgi:hypothetical protein
MHGDGALTGAGASCVTIPARSAAMPRTPAQPPRRPDPGTAPRDPAFSSGDRNTKSSEQDWPLFDGGVQREATPARAPRDMDDRRLRPKR